LEEFFSAHSLRSLRLCGEFFQGRRLHRRDAKAAKGAQRSFSDRLCRAWKRICILQPQHAKWMYACPRLQHRAGFSDLLLVCAISLRPRGGERKQAHPKFFRGSFSPLSIASSQKKDHISPGLRRNCFA